MSCLLLPPMNRIAPEESDFFWALQLLESVFFKYYNNKSTLTCSNITKNVINNEYCDTFTKKIIMKAF